ncbi:phytanoyl-CoA dioxygenase family protein [Curvivirga sp.]|uniref:phytanoyl-CoA dioxygenase family protein n=1 Tax=Curvivirga sp. TaxID=2856848 RepID=UPI003B58BC1E
MKHASQISTKWYQAFYDFLYAVDDFSPLRPLLPVTETEFSDLKIRSRVVSNAKNHIQGYMNQPLRDATTLAFKYFISTQMNLTTEVTETEELSNITNVGYTEVPSISSDLLQSIRKYLDTQTLYVGDTQKDLKPTNLNDAANHNMARYEVRDLIRSIDILYAATSDRFLQTAESYIGHPVIITNISSWWSFSGHSEPKNAQNFHFDLDDFRFCKGFIYLTDVDDHSGPHCYYPETHNLTKLQEILKSSNNPQEFINWYVKEFRKTDEDCEMYLKSKPVNLTGPAGTCLLVDTSGIHKGLIPKNKDRQIIQFEYGQTCFPQTPIQLVPFSQLIESKPELKDHFLQPNVKYTCQLLIDYEA